MVTTFKTLSAERGSGQRKSFLRTECVAGERGVRAAHLPQRHSLGHRLLRPADPLRRRRGGPANTQAVLNDALNGSLTLRTKEGAKTV